MPNTEEARGLLAKNSEIRNEMLKRKKVSSNGVFLIEGKEEYQDTFNSDSKLYDIGAERYMSHMSLNAYLNKDRYLGQKYITPSLTEFYGTNPQITGNIGYFNIYQAHNGFFQKENGRIVDDYNDGVHFINVEGGEPLDSDKFYFLQRNLKRSSEYQIKNKLGLESDTYTPNGINYPNNIDTSLPSFAAKSYTTDNDYDTFYGKSEYTKEIIEGTDRSKGLLHTTENLFNANQIRNLENTHSKRLWKKDKTGYLRNWNQKQNEAYNDSIKNFAGNYKKDEGNLYSIEEIQKNYNGFRAEDGATYLSNNSVLQKTGFVNIVRRQDKENVGNIKKCMFSIENLAWKDVPKTEKEKYLSSEQIGPNGGRIMWFPPYDISFDESVNVNWNSNTFIGRGEKVYTYTDTERNATLNFLLLIDHPNIINEAVKGVTDIDEDILRFFNGEQLLEVKKQEEINEDKGDGEPPQGPQQSFNKNKSVIEFSLYFPNNYSGMYWGYDGILNEREFERNYHEYIDTDWWIYLLIGRNLTVNEWKDESIRPSEWRGYEIAADKGLTDTSVQEQGKIFIEPVIDNSLLVLWENISPKVILEDPDGKESYYYRVDYDMRQRLEDIDGYKDLADSLMLNNFVIPSTGNEYDSDGEHYSSAEVIAAIVNHTGKEDVKYSKLVDYITDGAGGSRGRINEIKKKINSQEIESIEITQSICPNEGSSEESARILAKRRAYAVKDFLETQLRDKNLPNISINTGVTDSNSENTDLEKQKKSRRINVNIRLRAQNIGKLSDTAVGLVTNNNGESGTTNNLTINNGDSTNSSLVGNTADGKQEEGEPTQVPTESRRYETEAEYFETIKENDSMVYKTITEKLKYFNPAFHSISPEGFNARLTFIQQCTRQGHTIENSDKNGFAQTAGNLAFGRMPVCVLTLGDFINTRVLINSVSISYSDDGMQWDLNKTGVGVQPMFAKISLQMHVLGGQSLQGPISRLQNAVSFNYYANTGVYDDRADRAYIEEKDGKYEEKYTKEPWVPYPDNK